MASSFSRLKLGFSFLLFPLFLAIFAGGAVFVSLPVTEPDSPISLEDFAHLFVSLAEPEGYFDSDNFVSNEAAYLKILPAMRRLGVRGGAYLGVGPDQNYSYIGEIRPQLAVILDIRRQNSLQHLYYKALFHLSANRKEYVERLFGRVVPRHGPSPEQPKIAILLRAVDAAPRDPSFETRKLAEVKTVIQSWKLGLKEKDWQTIEYIARAFFEGGPDLKFTSYFRTPRPHHPTYRSLIEETDIAGLQSSYLADETRFQVVKKMQGENRILPVVGDFGGNHAFLLASQELRHRGLSVKCVYASNVEFYLFNTQRWEAYIRNLRTLPLASDAVIIRAYANMWEPHPAQIPGYYMTTILQSLPAFLSYEATGKNRSYWDMVTRDYIAR